MYLITSYLTQIFQMLLMVRFHIHKYYFTCRILNITNINLPNFITDKTATKKKGATGLFEYVKAPPASTFEYQNLFLKDFYFY